MSITFDASQTAGNTNNPSVVEWQHTPSGANPRGVLVFVIQRPPVTGPSEQSVGGVLYGNRRLKFLKFAQDSTGDDGLSYVFFAGDNIPTGTQTIRTFTGGHQANRFFVSMTLNADTDIIPEHVNKAEDDQVNTTIVLTTGSGVECFCAGALFSGHSDPSNIPPQGGYTEVATTDFGSKVGSVIRRTTNSTGGNVTLGWTHTSEDVAAVAVALKEGTVKPQLQYSRTRIVSEDTHTGDTLWTDVPFQHILTSGNLIPNNRYFVFSRSRVNPDGTDEDSVGIRVIHGSTPFEKSTFDTPVPAPTNSVVYGWFDVWTAKQYEDLKLQFKVVPSGAAIKLNSHVLTAIELDGALTENTDWFFNEASGDSLLQTTWASGAEITFTPEQSGDYLILAYEQYQTHATDGTVGIRTRITQDGSEAIFAQQEGKPSGYLRIVPLMWHAGLDATEHKFVVQGSATSDNFHTRLHSSLFILRLNAFENYFVVKGTGEIDMTNTEWGTTLNSGNLTHSQFGDVAFFTGVITDNHTATHALGRHRIRVNDSLNFGGDSEDSNTPWDTLDEMSNINVSIGISLSGANYYMEQQASDNPSSGDGDVTAEDYMLAAFSTFLASEAASSGTRSLSSIFRSSLFNPKIFGDQIRHALHYRN